MDKDYLSDRECFEWDLAFFQGACAIAAGLAAHRPIVDMSGGVNNHAAIAIEAVDLALRISKEVIARDK